jgi:hypothetical protein
MSSDFPVMENRHERSKKQRARRLDFESGKTLQGAKNARDRVVAEVAQTKSSGGKEEKMDVVT